MRGRFLLSFALAVFCLGLGMGFGRAPVDNTVRSLLGEHTPAHTRYRRFLEQFGTDEIIVIRVHGPDLRDVLTRTASVTRILQADPIVERILGPHTVFPEVASALEDPAVAELLDREAVDRTLDGPLNRALSLLERTPPSCVVIALAHVSPPEPRARLFRTLEAWRETLGPDGMTAAIAGPPLLNLKLDQAGRRVDRIALPVLAIVTLIVLGGLLRSIGQTAALLVPVGLAIAATTGGLSALGGTRNVIVDVANPLVFVLLVATGLHIVVAYRRHRAGGATRAAAARTAAREKRMPCLWALGTTAVGFGSLALSDVPPIRTFGALTAAGLILGAPLLLIVLPALLEQTPAGRKVRPPARLVLIARGMMGTAARRPWRWIGVGLALALAGAAAYPHLSIEPHAVRYFPVTDPLRRDSLAINRHGPGTATLELVLTATRSWTEQLAHLRRIDERLDRALREIPGVHARVGPALFLREAAHRQGLEEGFPDPLTARQVFRSDALSGFVDTSTRTLRVAVLIADKNASELDTLRATIHRALGDVVHRDSLSVTGNYDLLLAAQDNLLETLQRSLLITALLMELAFFLAFRSVRIALIAFLPNAVPVAANFALMAGLGFPIDLGTAMTAAVALGIAVDDTLHLVVAWKTRTLDRCARDTGQALILSSVVVALGFLSLAGSPFFPVQRFGILTASAMVWALIADLTVLPALLKKFGRPPRGGE